MKVQGDYSRDGYALVEALVPRDLAKALLDQLWSDLLRQKVELGRSQDSNLLDRTAVELHCSSHAPLKTFLWGLTPTASQLTGRELLPSYCFLRLYREGDTLRVHSDRNECEHSLSLTLAYSDDRVWDFDVGQGEAAETPGLAEDFGAEAFSTVSMKPGDAVLYRGIARRHGRLKPNPNTWSAHLFLHWVDSEGPYRSLAFEDTDRLRA